MEVWAIFSKGRSEPDNRYGLHSLYISKGLAKKVMADYQKRQGHIYDYIISKWPVKVCLVREKGAYK